MKGTLVAADFIKDSNQELRLTDIHTDAGFISDTLKDLDLSEWINVLQENYIDKVDVVFKSHIHSKIVDRIEEILKEEAPFVKKFTRHKEQNYSHLPKSVPDTATRFILRIVYDKKALLDRTYAKSRLKLYKLFTESGNEKLVPEFAYKGEKTFINTFTDYINEGPLPDVITKSVDKQFNKVQFYKVGKKDLEVFLSKFDDKTDLLIEKAYFNSITENKHSTYRQYSIIYGPELDIIPILQYRVSAILELPEEITTVGKIKQCLVKKHFYEFSTSYLPANTTGIGYSHEIRLEDGNSKPIWDINLEEDTIFSTDAKEPVVEDITTWEAANNIIVRLDIQDEYTFVSPGKDFEIYNKEADRVEFKAAIVIDPETDKIKDGNGNWLSINSVDILITEEPFKLADLSLDNGTVFVLENDNTGVSCTIKNRRFFSIL